MKKLNPNVICKDGFKLSIQASSTHYSAPREDSGPYYQVECGFPSQPPLTAEFLEYAEMEGDPCETVYPYVPIEVVLAELDAHGGVVALEHQEYLNDEHQLLQLDLS